MKTLSAWIAGIFALGVMLGSFVSGSGAVPELADSDLEQALEAAPLVSQVDCGDGRKALLEPVEVDGETTFKVRCVSDQPEPEPEPERVVARPSPPTPAPVVSSPPPEPASVETSDPNADVIVERDQGRTWKESAVVIGGAAGAGAGIGAIAKGKKGAAVGAAIGAASGAAYELMKKDKNN